VPHHEIIEGLKAAYSAIPTIITEAKKAKNVYQKKMRKIKQL
jgi:hypothetical protein